MGQELPAHPRRNGEEKEQEREEIQHMHTQELSVRDAIECGMFPYLFCWLVFSLSGENVFLHSISV